ncbi:hypothetical protein A9R05_27890 [Burkholderia sp. KK1]|nr:hypothetical protein A9R05_27890 [Burkholderia sp. KK1]
MRRPAMLVLRRIQPRCVLDAAVLRQERIEGGVHRVAQQIQRELGQGHGRSRHRDHVPGGAQRIPPGAHHRAPADEVRIAQAEERQGRLGQDRVGDQQCVGDENRREGVGQDLDENQMRIARAERHACADEPALAQYDELASRGRAMLGHAVTPSAKMVDPSEGVRIATRMMASKNGGTVWKNSVMAIRIWSSAPPK